MSPVRAFVLWIGPFFWGVVHILQAALRDVLAVFWKLVPLAAIPALPAAIVIARLECESSCQPMGWLDQNQVLSAFDMILGAPAAVAATRLLMRRDVSLGGAVAYAARKWFSSGEIRMVVGLMTSIGIFLLAVPALLIVVFTSLALPALALGAADSNAALRQSAALARNAFWKLLALLVFSSLPELAMEGLFAIAPDHLVDNLWTDAFVLWAELTLSGLVGAFSLAAMAEVYVELTEDERATK